MMRVLDDYLTGGTVHGAEISYDCPFCVTNGHSPDTTEKLWVNYSKRIEGANSPGVFVCYRCEAKGTVEYLLKWLGGDPEASPINDEFTRMLRAIHGDEAPPVAPAALPDYTQDLFGMGCYPIGTGSASWTYLRERGVSEEDMVFYRMLEGRGRYHHRIVVPTLDFDRRVPFFVARSTKQLYFDIPGKGRVEAPKYLNPKGEGRKFSIFNLNTAIESETIVITEGVFSSIAAGRNAVATFGKLVTQTQVSMLRAHAAGKELVVCFDADAHAQVINLAAKLSELQLRTSFVLLPGSHDPATLSKSELEYLLKHRYPYSVSMVLQLQAEGSFQWSTTKNSGVTDQSLTTRFESSMGWLTQASSLAR